VAAADCFTTMHPNCAIGDCCIHHAA
jgi:hypothetical protein